MRDKFQIDFDTEIKSFEQFYDGKIKMIYLKIAILEKNIFDAVTST